MDTSKGSLEAVSGSNLPLKVEKDMTADEVRVLAQKTFRLRSVFLGLENYVLLYPDTKLVYHMLGTDELFTVAKYKKVLDKPYSKICFYLCFIRMRNTIPVYSKDLQILYVKYIRFCDIHHVYMCRFCKSNILSFVM